MEDPISAGNFVPTPAASRAIPLWTGRATRRWTLPRSEQELLDQVYRRSAQISRRRLALQAWSGGLAIVLALSVAIPIVLRGGTASLPGHGGDKNIAAPPHIDRPTVPPVKEPPRSCTCRPPISSPPKQPTEPPDTSIPPKTPDAPPAPAGARIAFASDRAGNFDIYTMEASGGDIQRLTFDPAQERDPAWSPDGKQIAFTRKKGLTDFTGEVWIMNADGTNQRRLVQGGAPRFSPDGKQMAFHALLGEGPGIPLSLWVINLDGTGKRHITDEGGDPAWTPDGRSLVYGGITGPIVNVWKIALSPGATREHLYNDPIFACMPDVSPDGSRVAYVTAILTDIKPSSIATKLVVASIGGPSGGRVTTSPNWEFAPSWSADGTLIAVERDTDLDPHYATYAGGVGPDVGRSWIAVVKADGSGEYAIPNGSHNDADPAFSPTVT